MFKREVVDFTCELLKQPSKETESYNTDSLQQEWKDRMLEPENGILKFKISKVGDKFQLDMRSGVWPWA